MSQVQRFDANGRLGKAKRTPQGGIEVPAFLRKSGVLVYTNPDGTKRREYVSPDELFKAQSLETLKHAPVSNLHPFGPGGQQLIDPENFRDFTVGHLSGEPRQEQEKLAGDLVIQDKRTISQVEKGERNEVSLGYVCAYEPTPGVTPSGERYDGVQRNIIYNHVALVPRGRAGRDVALRLDSAGNQMSPEGAPGENDTMKIEIINGVEYEIGTPAHTKAKADDAQVRADADDHLATVTAERDHFKAEKEKADKALSEKDSRFDSAVNERVELVILAKSKGVEVKAEDSNQDVRKALLGKLRPGIRLDGRDETYIQVALDLALESGNLSEAAQSAVPGNAPCVRTDEQDAMAPDVLARENMTRRLHGRPEIDRFGSPVAR